MAPLSLAYNSNRGILIPLDSILILLSQSLQNLLFITGILKFYKYMPWFGFILFTSVNLLGFFILNLNAIQLWKICNFFFRKDHHFQSEVHGNFFLNFPLCLLKTIFLFNPILSGLMIWMHCQA